MVEERLLDLLLPPSNADQDEDGPNPTREKFRAKLRSGKLEDKIVELDVQEQRSGPIM